MSHSRGRHSQTNRPQQQRNFNNYNPAGMYPGSMDQESQNRWEAEGGRSYEPSRWSQDEPDPSPFRHSFDRRGDDSSRSRDSRQQGYRMGSQDRMGTPGWNPGSGNREWVSGVDQFNRSQGQSDSLNHWQDPEFGGGMPGRMDSSRQQYESGRDNQFQSRSQQGGRQSFAGRGPQGYKRSDERITEDINEELTRDSFLDATNITVETKNGEVLLKGTVSDRESKRRAEEIAEGCSGVNDVQNQIRIKREDTAESNFESKRDRADEKRSKMTN